MICVQKTELITLGLALICLTFFSCDKTIPNEAVKTVSAMRRVMHSGDLKRKIRFDTMDLTDTYGIGPVEDMRGEILLLDGVVFVSEVVDETSMKVKEDPETGAPFFVYSRVEAWELKDLPERVKTINHLEKYLDQETKDLPRPFAFKLEGKVKSALIHVQNLPPGTKVSSHEEAHQGQVKYPLTEEEVILLGFFSKKHQGIFTHHDSDVHIHLMTQDISKMGHLDELQMEDMVLYLPKAM